MSNTSPENISVILDPSNGEQSKQIADKYNLVINSVVADDCQQWLEWVVDKKTQSKRLSLCNRNSGPVNIDFLSGKKAHRQKFGGGKGQPLVRAMGQLANGLPTILDATAGMGGDSFVLASLGFNVLMLERSPIVASLLEDALDRAQQNMTEYPAEIQQSIKNLSLIHADSAAFLLTEKPDIDVVYMDPMYPEKKKKAAAKKDMQALQHLVGPDIDSSYLLDAALQTAKYRVVVKRPKTAPILQSSLGDIEPSAQISSPNTRYDIYAIKALNASGKI